MNIQLNDWKFDDLKSKMIKMNVMQIQELYVKKEDEYKIACSHFLKSGLNKELEKVCDELSQEKIIIALTLAQKLTGVSIY